MKKISIWVSLLFLPPMIQPAISMEALHRPPHNVDATSEARMKTIKDMVSNTIGATIAITYEKDLKSIKESVKNQARGLSNSERQHLRSTLDAILQNALMHTPLELFNQISMFAIQSDFEYFLDEVLPLNSIEEKKPTKQEKAQKKLGGN